MAASSNYCCSWLPWVLHSGIQTTASHCWPDKYLGVASIGICKWKSWDQESALL